MGSSACPGDYGDFEVVITDEYTIYYTRCQGELCNDGPGDNSDDADNGGKLIFNNINFSNDNLKLSDELLCKLFVFLGDPDRSILVVPGRPDDYKK